MFVLYDFIIAHWFNAHNSVNGLFCWPDYEQGWKEVDCLPILQWKFCNLSVEALCLLKVWQQIMLNTYKLCLACVLALQYLQLEERGKAEVRVEKWPASPESSQIGVIEMWRKKCRFMNFNLKMQKELKKDLLKILKSYENLWESVLKAGENDLKNFENNSESSEGLLKSFEDALEGEVEPRTLSGDLDEDQFEAE